jgi:hypothetical protein
MRMTTTMVKSMMNVVRMGVLLLLLLLLLLLRHYSTSTRRIILAMKWVEDAANIESDEDNGIRGEKVRGEVYQAMKREQLSQQRQHQTKRRCTTTTLREADNLGDALGLVGGVDAGSSKDGGGASQQEHEWHRQQKQPHVTLVERKAVETQAVRDQSQVQRWFQRRDMHLFRSATIYEPRVSGPTNWITIVLALHVRILIVTESTRLAARNPSKARGDIRIVDAIYNRRCVMIS